MKIAFYKAWNGNYMDKIISIFTLSKYSHCELIFSNDICASSSTRDGGVRIKYIKMDHKWDVYTIDPIMELNETAILAWFVSNLGDKYDWPGAIGSLFGIDLTSEDKKFCSYACARPIGIYPIVTPAKLHKYLTENFLIKKVT